MGLPVLSALFLLLPAILAEQTPFCTQCKCVTNDDQTVDVDCSEANVKNYLYEHSYWFSDENATTSYPIRSLNLQNQGLKEIKAQFPVSNLARLDLSHNFIANITDMAFTNLESMEVLLLGFNDLEILKPQMFMGLRTDSRDYPLRAVKEFRLNDNHLHYLDQDLFEHLDGVETLDISGNPFKVIDVQTQIAITSLAYLKYLNMSRTQLKDIPEHFFHTPKHLLTVDLSYNAFEAVPPPLGEAHGLEVLHFDGNLIGNMTASNGFPTIPTVKTLHLCYSPRLYSIGKNSLSGLQNLEELHITHNLNLSEIAPGALTRREENAENEVWPPIRKLHLDNNKLTSLDFHLVINWDSLSELDLRYNAWTCECENQWMIEELMEAYVKVDEESAKEMMCAAPVEMKGFSFYELHEKKSDLRCLDVYGNRPEKDATILVGILAGLLIGIPVVLALMYAYQRNCFGLFDNSPASFSRQFYSRTGSDDVNF